MTRAKRKRIILIIVAVLVVAVVVWGFVPSPLAVETAAVIAAPMRVVIEEEGETSVERYYTVSAPVAGFARRIELQPGDQVAAGQPLVELEPPRSAVLDPRSAAQAAARVESAAAMLAQAETSAALAANERDRVRRLFENGSATARQLEQADADASRALAARDAARADLTAARAAAQTGELADGAAVRHVVRAPAAGRVLVVHRRSEGHVQPGEPLLDIGDTDRLEVHALVLSQDAVRLAPGTRVELDRWGGDRILEAIVTRVERQGRAVVSALGVEERRVAVTAELISPPEVRRNLGSGYRVLARFVVWEDEAVLQAPTGALFRSDDSWAVFTVRDGRAVRRAVDVGRQSGLTTQITSGLSEGDTVIVHPASGIEDGVRVTPR